MTQRIKAISAPRANQSSAARLLLANLVAQNRMPVTRKLKGKKTRTTMNPAIKTGFVWSPDTRSLILSPCDTFTRYRAGGKTAWEETVCKIVSHVQGPRA